MQNNILFSEFKNGKIKTKNRFVMPPMATFSSSNGVPSDKLLEYYVKRAENDVGLIISEAVAINHPTASTNPKFPNFLSNEALDKWRELVQKIHNLDTVIIPQIWHSGLAKKLAPVKVKANTTNFSSEITSPSGVYSDQSIIGRPLSVSEIEEIIYQFSISALTAKELGFDGVEIHGAHSQLIDNFFCPSTNKRNDEYGLHNRTLFAEKIIKQCRSLVGKDFPIIFRFSNWQLWNPLEKNFNTPKELEEFLLPLIDAGVDIFHCSARFFNEKTFKDHEGSIALWTKKITNLPVIAVGSVYLHNNLMDSLGGESSEYRNNVVDVEKCILNNEFDLIAIGRGLFYDHTLINKIRENKYDRVEKTNLLDILNDKDT